MKKFFIMLSSLLLATNLVSAEETKPATVELPSWISKFKISADARLRYQIEMKETADGTEQDRDRGRMRFRIKTQFQPSDSIKLVARLRTNNITMGKDNFDGEGNTENISALFDRYYFEAKPFSFLTITGGGFESPFSKSTLVWDTYYHMTGLVEDFHHSFKDANIALSAGQIMVGEPDWTGEDDDYFEKNLWLFVVRAEGSYKTGDLSFGAGITYWDYSDAIKFIGMEKNAEVQVEGPDYNLINPNLFISYDLTKTLPLTLSFDLINNLDADDHGMGWQAGLLLGKAKKANTFSIGGFYKHVEALATYGPMADSDNNIPVNGKGFNINAAYAVADFWHLEAKIWHTEKIEDELEGHKKYMNIHLQTIFKF